MNVQHPPSMLELVCRVWCDTAGTNKSGLQRLDLATMALDIQSAPHVWDSFNNNNKKYIYIYYLHGVAASVERLGLSKELCVVVQSTVTSILNLI